MLKEINCSLFNESKITFNMGLNVILGEDDAKNSIGKSTALMVIDFVFGGDSFLKDEAGAIKALGHHSYEFIFRFGGKLYFFSRSTSVPDIVNICDESFKRTSDLSIESYRKELKIFYALNDLESSFRSIVSPFTRIWKKGSLEPDQPFIAALKEPAGDAISRLIDLMGFSSLVSDEKLAIDKQRERKKLIVGSMNAAIIPKINVTQYKQNIRTINDNNLQMEQLKLGFSGAISAYEALFDADLQSMQQRKNELLELRDEYQIRIKRLQREISGITPRLTSNIALVSEYFPNVNVERLEKVELFHQKIGNIVKKELKELLSVTQDEESLVVKEVNSLEQEIQLKLKSKGLPDDLFTRLFTLKEITDKASQENSFYEQKVQIEDAIKTANQRLDQVYTNIFLRVERKVNRVLRKFNRYVYGPDRNSSELRIRSANSFSFTSPEDNGAGKSYAGLIGFDIAMLFLTDLPFVIHDSVVYKNIEVTATSNIIEILAAARSKQVFISLDEAKKFGQITEFLLNRCTVLRLSHKALLYRKNWGETKKK